MSVCEHLNDFGRAVCESQRKPLVWGERLGFETLMNILSSHLFDNTLPIHLPTQRDFRSVWNLDTSTLLQVWFSSVSNGPVCPSQQRPDIDINLFPRQCTLQCCRLLTDKSYEVIKLQTARTCQIYFV